MTGFTFEVDGPPEHVERLWKAVGAVLEEMSREAREREPEVYSASGAFFQPWFLPVRGQIRFRHDAFQGAMPPVVIGENWNEPFPRPPSVLGSKPVGKTVRTISV